MGVWGASGADPQWQSRGAVPKIRFFGAGRGGQQFFKGIDLVVIPAGKSLGNKGRTKKAGFAGQFRASLPPEPVPAKVGNEGVRGIR